MKTIQQREDSGREIAEWVYRHHRTTRSYRDEIIGRAKELGLTMAIRGEVCRVVLGAAQQRLGEMLDAEVTP